MKRKVIYPKRCEVYLVDFNPTIGEEIKKTRPALVLQIEHTRLYRFSKIEK